MRLFDSSAASALHAPRLFSSALHWLVCTLALVALVPTAARPAAAQERRLGTNLGFLAEGEGEWPFVNAFKISAGWFAGERGGCFDCAGPLDLDSEGYVASLDPMVPNGGQVAHALVFNEVSGHYPSGEYIVLYEGQGTFEYSGSAVHDVAASTPGRDVIRVDSSSPDPLVMTLLATAPSNHLHNIRLLMPGGVCANDPLLACERSLDCAGGATCEMFESNYEQQIFHPTFLRNLRRYSVVRFMDWMLTNENLLSDIDTYPQVSSARWRMAPIEIMAELGNRLQADVWVNVPHRADDRFIEEMAGILARDLDTGLKAYVEYSNEVWNPSFLQHAEVAVVGCQTFPSFQAGCDTDLSPGNGVFCEGHPSPRWNDDCAAAERRYFSQRTVEAWDIFESVFGGHERLVRVMGSQTGNVQFHREHLDWQDAWQKTDALGTAMYFGFELGSDRTVAGWGLAQLFDEIQNRSIPNNAFEFDRDHAFLAQNYPSIELLAYEGGQHLQASLADPVLNAQMVDLFTRANRDDRMEGAYIHLLKRWWGLEQPLFMHYKNVQKPSDDGTWGSLEYQDQRHTHSPKHRALTAVLDQL